LDILLSFAAMQGTDPNRLDEARLPRVALRSAARQPSPKDSR